VSTRTLGISDTLHEYLLGALTREPPVLARLREETSKLAYAGMQISPEQGRFMQWLVGLVGARRCLEVGVFTGYSSLSVGLALPDDGRVVACDVSDEWTRVARRYWAEAGIAHKFELRLGPALTTLDALAAAGELSTFDFAFIDADKDNYRAYYERCLGLLRPGGVLAVDNALWSGKVADPTVTDKDTSAIRELNAHAVSDPRVSASMITIGDGLLVARKL
jgi:caffeoyl-CoA O-methyltransferase